MKKGNKKPKSIAVAKLSQELGISRAAIYKALKNGKLNKAEAGYIAIDELYKLFTTKKSNSLDVEFINKPQTKKKQTKKPKLKAEIEDFDDEPEDFDVLEIQKKYAKAQADRMHYNAANSKLEYSKRIKEVVDKQEVIFAVEEAMLRFTKKIGYNLPSTLQATLSMFFTNSPLINDCMIKIRDDIDNALASLNEELKSLKIHDKGDEDDDG